MSSLRGRRGLFWQHVLSNKPSHLEMVFAQATVAVRGEQKLYVVYTIGHLVSPVPQMLYPNFICT